MPNQPRIKPPKHKAPKVAQSSNSSSLSPNQRKPAPALTKLSNCQSSNQEIKLAPDVPLKQAMQQLVSDLEWHSKKRKDRSTRRSIWAGLQLATQPKLTTISAGDDSELAKPLGSEDAKILNQINWAVALDSGGRRRSDEKA